MITMRRENVYWFGIAGEEVKGFSGRLIRPPNLLSVFQEPSRNSPVLAIQKNHRCIWRLRLPYGGVATHPERKHLVEQVVRRRSVDLFVRDHPPSGERVLIHE